MHEPAVPLIAVDFAFSGGAAQDPAGKAGTANLVASLLDDGVGDFDSKTFHDRLERKAIELNFSADREHIRGSLRTLSENRDEAFEDLRLGLTAPRFDAADVELNRAQILSALRRATTSPSDIANRRWWETAFAGHPYGRPVSGTLESVPTITIDDRESLYAPRAGARQSQDRHGRRHRCRDGKDHARPRVRRAAGEGGARPGRQARVAAGSRPPHRRQSRRAAGGDRVRRRRHRAARIPDFMAAYIVNHILGGGTFSSRLYQEVREKRGLAYSVYDSLLWLDHTALFLGSTATRDDRTGETLDLIQKEIHRLAEDGPTADELAKAKAYLNSSFALNLDTSSKIARSGAVAARRSRHRLHRAAAGDDRKR